LFELGYFALDDSYHLIRRSEDIGSIPNSILDNSVGFKVPHEFPPSPSFLKEHRQRENMTA
jgi:hypothetical protein